jgi:hypothetical protein
MHSHARYLFLFQIKNKKAEGHPATNVPQWQPSLHDLKIFLRQWSFNPHLDGFYKAKNHNQPC